jgi:hypothetical protein
MPSLHTIDAELAHCRAELSHLLRAEEETPAERLDIQWVKQCDQWEEQGADPTLNTLYSWIVQTPAPVAVIRYMVGVFNGDNAYRHVRLNFFGSDSDVCIANLFYWYHKKNRLRRQWLDRDPSIDRGVLGSTRHIDPPHARVQWYTTFTVGERVIYFTWRRPSELVLDVVFTSDPALYESNEPWEELTAKCTDA